MANETQNNGSRFKDGNFTLYNFKNNVFVVCPKCTLRAIVKSESSSPRLAEKILSCPNCHFSKHGRKETYRVELNCNCSNCSAEINLTIPIVNEKKELISVNCKSCGITQNYKPRNIAQEWMYSSNGEAVEDYFGLPLWISSNFKGFTFWAYNYEHLEYLKKYISADLRERNNRTFWTMVEKLPTWMKSSKNREKLIKLIDDLERK